MAGEAALIPGQQLTDDERRASGVCRGLRLAVMEAAIASGAAVLHRVPDGFFVTTTTAATPDSRPGLFVWLAVITGGNAMRRYRDHFAELAERHGASWVIFRSTRRGYIRALCSLDRGWRLTSGRRISVHGQSDMIELEWALEV